MENVKFCDSWLERILCFLFRFRDIVKEVDGQDVLYLRRWFVVHTRWFKLWLHKIARSDEDRDPHDHPWSFWVIPLRKGYDDETWEWQKTSNGYVTRTTGRVKMGLYPVKLGRIYKRKATHIHRVRLTNGTAWTLIVRSPKKREWGFWTQNGWVHWKEYLGTEKNIDEGYE